jgi:hypothetical protein
MQLLLIVLKDIYVKLEQVHLHRLQIVLQGITVLLEQLRHYLVLKVKSVMEQVILYLQL